MPRLNIDATEAQSFEAIPEAEYLCEVKEISDVKTGQKSQYITAEMEIIDGEYAGRKLWRNCPIEGPGAGILVDFINKATGENYEVGEEIPDFDTDDLLGARLRVVTENEEYAGEMRSQVKRVLAYEA